MSADPYLVDAIRTGRTIPPDTFSDADIEAAKKAALTWKEENATMEKERFRRALGCQSCHREIPDEKQAVPILGKHVGRLCEHCAPLEERKILREQLESANVPRHFIEAVSSAGESYSRPEGKHWTLILGAVGVGKTFRAVQLVVGDWNARFVSWPEFITARKLAMSEKAPDPVGEVRSHRHTLVLDDLGGEPLSAYSSQSANEVLCYRYDRDLPTVITSNLNLEALSEVYGARIASRLCEAAHIVSLKETRDLRRVPMKVSRRGTEA